MKPDIINRAMSHAFEQADAFSQSPEFLAAFHAATDSVGQRDLAINDPERYLRSMSVNVPKGLAVTFFNEEMRGKTAPDFEFFTIRLFRCRTYVVKKTDGPGYEKAEICFGFEIVPNFVPGGPIPS